MNDTHFKRVTHFLTSRKCPNQRWTSGGSLGIQLRKFRSSKNCGSSGSKRINPTEARHWERATIWSRVSHKTIEWSITFNKDIASPPHLQLICSPHFRSMGFLPNRQGMTQSTSTSSRCSAKVPPDVPRGAAFIHFCSGMFPWTVWWVLYTTCFCHIGSFPWSDGQKAIFMWHRSSRILTASNSFQRE